MAPLPIPGSLEVDLPQTLAARITASRAGRASPFLVAICGWADTGKSTLAAQLCVALDRLGITADAISTDDFMLDRAERNALGISGYDFRSLDVPAVQRALTSFVNREPFGVHPYDNKTGTKKPEAKTVVPAAVLVVEGIHALHVSLSDQMDLKVFIDSDETTLRQMRYRANMQKRGMTAHDAAVRISNEWEDYNLAVRPRSKVADVVVAVDTEFKYRCLKNTA